MVLSITSLENKFKKSMLLFFTMLSLIFFIDGKLAFGNEVFIAHDTSNPQRNPPLKWLKKFTWYYSDYAEPSWLSKPGIDLFMVASKAWENCGVEIEFLGGSHSPTLEKNNINVMGWIENPSQKLRGITLRTPEKGSQPIALHEADVGINSLNLQLKNNPRLLQKVIIHEFGHALGLIHSNYCNDVMSSASACGALIAPLPPIEPTINDIAQCNSLYKNNSDDTDTPLR